MPVDKSSQRVQRMFGEIAPRYDLLNHLLSMNIDRYWRWRTVRIVRATSDRPILDVLHGNRRPGIRILPPDGRPGFRRGHGFLSADAGDRRSQETEGRH